MALTIRAFGMTAEATNSDHFTLPYQQDTQCLRRSLEEKYPELKKIKYTFSINRKISLDTDKISDGAEIALLPPFSGG